MTRSVAEKCHGNMPFVQEIMNCMERYKEKDWGNVAEDSKIMNDENASIGIRSLMGVYETCEGTIWIMTEHDRSITTILFPEDY